MGLKTQFYSEAWIQAVFQGAFWAVMHADQTGAKVIFRGKKSFCL